MKSSSKASEANAIAVIMNGRPVFHTTRRLRPNEELSIFFDEPEVDNISEVEDVIIDVDMDEQSESQNCELIITF